LFCLVSCKNWNRMKVEVWADPIFVQGCFQMSLFLSDRSEIRDWMNWNQRPATAHHPTRIMRTGLNCPIVHRSSSFLRETCWSLTRINHNRSIHPWPRGWRGWGGSLKVLIWHDRRFIIVPLIWLGMEVWWDFSNPYPFLGTSCRVSDKSCKDFTDCQPGPRGTEEVKVDFGPCDHSSTFSFPWWHFLRLRPTPFQIHWEVEERGLENLNSKSVLDWLGAESFCFQSKLN